MRAGTEKFVGRAVVIRPKLRCRVRNVCPKQVELSPWRTIYRAAAGFSRQSSGARKRRTEVHRHGNFEFRELRGRRDMVRSTKPPFTLRFAANRAVRVSGDSPLNAIRLRSNMDFASAYRAYW